MDNEPISHKDEQDALLALRGSGKQLWADEHADAHINRLRQGWDADDQSTSDLANSNQPAADQQTDN